MARAGERFIAYPVGNAAAWNLKAASVERSWMETSSGRFAYRCLPLAIANQAGWVIECPVRFNAIWNGASEPSGSIAFQFEPPESGFEAQIRSFFGSGIITFSIPYLFRTPPGIGMLVRGVPNESTFNAAPLEGFVETDWASATFTMNWKIQRAGVPVEFEKGTGICFLQPMNLSLIEALEPELRPLKSDPEIEIAYHHWRDSRIAFNAKEDRGADWQKDYFKGKKKDGSKHPSHRTSVALREFQ